MLPSLPLSQPHDEVNNNFSDSKLDSFHTNNNNNSNKINNNNNNLQSKTTTTSSALQPEKDPTDITSNDVVLTDDANVDESVAIYELNSSFRIEVREQVCTTIKIIILHVLSSRKCQLIFEHS
jgi:hypothetical protein